MSSQAQHGMPFPIQARDRIRMFHGSEKFPWDVVQPYVHELLDRFFFFEPTTRSAAPTLCLSLADSNPLDKAIEYWRCGQVSNSTDQEHWLHTEAKAKGILPTLGRFATKFLFNADREYVELLRQFLLYYGDKGLDAFLLTIPAHPKNMLLIVEALNQAFEAQRGTTHTTYGTPHPWDCDCERCRHEFCFKASSCCTCWERRRAMAREASQATQSGKRATNNHVIADEPANENASKKQRTDDV